MKGALRPDKPNGAPALLLFATFVKVVQKYCIEGRAERDTREILGCIFPVPCIIIPELAWAVPHMYPMVQNATSLLY